MAKFIDAAGLQRFKTNQDAGRLEQLTRRNVTII